MKVISLGVDSNLFKEGSPVRARQVEYGKLVDELYIVTYTQLGVRDSKLASVKLGENVWVYPTNSKNRLSYFWDAYKIARDILRDNPGRYIITSQEGMTNFVALFLSLKFKLGIEMQVHTDIFSKYFRKESLTNKFRLFGYWLAARRARSIRVVSKRIAKGLRERWHVPGNKITVLPVYVDSSRWQEVQGGVDLHKQYPDASHIILMASRITPEKNFPLALRSFERVRARYPKARLIVVGDGPLAHLIKGEGIELLPWAADLSSLYRSADIFLLTSNYEGYGLTLIEAAISGTPIVTTDVGIVGSIINPHNALIAEVGDVNKVAAHLIFLLQNQDARIMMSERLKKVAEKLPDKETYQKLFKQSWEKCLNQK